MTIESFKDGDIRRVSQLDLTFKPTRWAFADQRRAEIDSHFEEQRKLRSLWNGRVMLARNTRLNGDSFSADYFETDYASFLAWRAWGGPDPEIRNCYGMGAVRTTDGAFILGEMAERTASPGSVYFPAGTPDPSDRAGEIVDLTANVVRETEEEIGVPAGDYVIQPEWTAVRDAHEIAFIRVLQAGADAESLKRKIEGWLAAQAKPEFARIFAVRTMRDLPERTIRPVRIFLGTHLPG